ncbi:threonine-phosphate decarboxylase CobD [Prosthecomicrobium sp. N25]|uniref:threonine-phosphate decarboxylase CobD n=1 Tax=Prosthecomicrobium sp. N25 TaxID=3129254 RepID=UPI0030784823
MSAAGRGAPIHHGGNLDAARAAFPGAPEPWIDLSTGINPVPYPIPPIPPEAWTRLPGRAGLAALEETARRAYGADAATAVVAGPGTQALIQRLPELVPGRSVAVLGPTYQEHGAAWRAAGRAVSTVRDPDALAAADVAVLVNPNNPDGRLLPPAILQDLAARLAARGGLLVVDEAFMDVVRPAASLLPGRPANALVLRSFGKAYGLAGVRLGFALGPDALVEGLRAALGPWAVPGPAIAVGRAALSDSAWLEAAVSRLARDAARLDALLGPAGFEVVGGSALYRLARSPDAPALRVRLGGAGILVRRFEDPSLLRFGMPGDESAWTRLAAALKGPPRTEIS